MDLRAILTGTHQPGNNQNLADLNKVRPRSTPERPLGYGKSLAIDVLAIGSAALSGFLYYRFIVNDSSVWFVLAGLVFFGVMTVLQAFLPGSGGRRSLAIVLETVALFIFFRGVDIWILLATGAVVFLLLLLGYTDGRSHAVNSLQIPFWRGSCRVLGKFTTALLIFMVLVYVPQIQSGSSLVPRQNFKIFFDWAAGVVENFYPNLSLQGTFGNFAQSLARMELENNQNFQGLPKAQQDVVVNQTAAELSANISKSASVQTNPQEPASDAFYNLLGGVLNAWQKNSSGWFAFGWAAVLFLALRGLGVFFIWFTQIAAVIVYEVLLASGFIVVIEEQQPKEVISF